MTALPPAPTAGKMAISPRTKSSDFAHRAPSIVLIGFRGVGKSTLGLIIATHLNCPFIDADRALSSVAKCSPNEYIRRNSWDKFRDLETDILARILRDHPSGHVIACGGGVVERQQNRHLLSEHGRRGGFVLHITREKEEVIRYLIDEKDRPQWGEEIRSVWARRFPLFEECSTHSYVTLTARNKPRAPSLMLKDVEQDCLRYIQLLLRTAPPSIHPDRRTYSLCIDLPVPQQLTHEVIETAAAGVNVLELRVDSLRRQADQYQTSPDTPLANTGAPDSSYIAFAVAHMRRVSDLPLIYSLRTLKQSGSFTFEHSTPADYARLAETAYKCGIEYLELGLDIDRDILRSILKKKPPYVSCILSFYDTEGHLSWMSSQVLAKYHEAIALGADIVKLVLVAQAVEDNLALHHFLQARAAEKRSTRLIAYNVGHLGKMSVLFNQTFTPVYHPILSVPIAPGTTTFGETQQALFACGLVSTSYLLCSQSDERAYAAFMRGIRLLNLPIAVKEHDGDINEAGKLGAVGEFEMKGSEHIKYASNASRWIALSDTVTRGLLSDDVQQGSSSSYYHDNMQMQAIAACIAANLSPINAVTHKSVAVLLGAHGAGGRAAAYALLHLGVQQIICFECEEGITAEEAFSSTDAEGLSVQIPPTIIVSFSLPEMLAVYKGLLESPTGGVALNLSQGNSVELGSMTSTTRCKESWIHVDTIDVERIRITRQFEMITGHRLPKAALAM